MSGLNEWKAYQTIKEETLHEFDQNNKIVAEKLKEDGNAFLKKGKFKSAISCYNEAASADPTNAIYFSNLCFAYIKMCDYPNALKCAEKSIIISPEWVKGYYFLGTIHYTLCNYSEALRNLYIAQAKDRSNTQVTHYIKTVSERIQKLHEHPFRASIIQKTSNEFDKRFELEVIRRTIKDTKDPYALWKLAQDAIEREKYREALHLYLDLVECSGQEQNYYTYIMFCHIMLGEHKKAFELLDKVESPVWIEQLGITLFHSGSVYAIPFFEKSLSLGCKTNLNFFAGFLGICYLAGNFTYQDLEKARKYLSMAEGDECKEDLETLDSVQDFLKTNPTKEVILERIGENPEEEVPLLGYLCCIKDIDFMKQVLIHHKENPETQFHMYRDLVTDGNLDYCEILAKLYVKEGDFEKAREIMNLCE